jgi:hypothetical protein
MTPREKAGERADLASLRFTIGLVWGTAERALKEVSDAKPR